MTASVRARIFQPFYTTKGAGRGTGLGLSTSLTIVREHGGSIDCTSAPGAGTIFRILLPAASPAEESAGAATARAAGGGESILIVDDEETVRDVMRRLLEREGYVTHVASSGTEALQALTSAELRRSLRLVILDMSMPGMSGRAVRQKLRELLPDTPVVYFTGYAIEPPEDADGIIHKPITAAKLARVVREALERKGRVS